MPDTTCWFDGSAAQRKLARAKGEEQLKQLVTAPVNLSILKFSSSTPSIVDRREKVFKGLVPANLFSAANVLANKKQFRAKKCPPMCPQRPFYSNMLEEGSRKKKIKEELPPLRLSQHRKSIFVMPRPRKRERDWTKTTIARLSKRCSWWIAKKVMQDDAVSAREQVIGNILRFHGECSDAGSEPELLPAIATEADRESFYNRCATHGIMMRKAAHMAVPNDEKMTLKELAMANQRDLFGNQRTMMEWEFQMISKHNQKRLPVMENIERDAALPKVRPRSAAYNLQVTSNASILAEMTDTEEFENDEAEEPLIIAVKVWQAAWGNSANWIDLSLHELRLILERKETLAKENCMSALAASIIYGRKTKHLSADEKFKLDEELSSVSLEQLNSSNVRVKLAACAIILITPISGHEQTLLKVLNEIVNVETEISDVLFGCCMLAHIGGDDIHDNVSFILFQDYVTYRKPYILKLLKKTSAGNQKTHKILSEFLNSGIPEERAIACYVLSELEAEMMSDAIEDKLVEMQWYDQMKSVQKAALLCLHKTGRESRVFEFILNLLADSLESVKKHDVTVAALEWIVNNGGVSDKLIRILLICFQSKLGTIRSATCFTVGELRIKHQDIVENLITILSYETLPAIKKDAIDALAKIEPGKGRQKDEITAALAHAVRFEEHPRVRRAAAYAIYILDVFQNETLAEVIRERIVVEPEEDVQEVLRLILDKLNLTVKQVLNEDEMLVQMKIDIKELCRPENVIPSILARKKRSNYHLPSSPFVNLSI